MLNEIALGGEETGKNMAVEAESAIIRAISVLYSEKIAMPSGIITVLAAVLLMMFDTNIVIKAKTAIKT